MKMYVLAAVLFFSVFSMVRADLDDTYTFEDDDTLWNVDLIRPDNAAYAWRCASGGWQAINGLRSLILSNGSTNEVTAVMTDPDNIVLEGGKRYKLTFKYRIWEADSDDNMTILAMPDGVWDKQAARVLTEEHHPDGYTEVNMIKFIPFEGYDDHLVRFQLTPGMKVILDDLKIEQLPQVTIDAGGSVSVSDYEPYGINALFENQVDYPTTNDIDIAMTCCDAMGIQWIRVGLRWAWIESVEDTYNASALQRLHDIASLAAQHNLQIMFHVLSAPDWAEPAGQIGVDMDCMDDWEEFIDDMAYEFDDAVDYWEIGNEIDGDFWNAPNTNYFEYLKRAYSVLKNTPYSNNTIILAPVTWDGTHTEYEQGGNSCEYWMQKMYNLGVKNWFDIAAIHTYSTRQSYSVYEEMDQINELYRTMKHNGDQNKRIWVTEWSAWGGDRTNAQIEDVAFDGYAYMLNHPQVDKIFYFKLLSDNAASPLASDGTLRTNVFDTIYDVPKYPDDTRLKNWGMVNTNEFTE